MDSPTEGPEVGTAVAAWPDEDIPQTRAVAKPAPLPNVERLMELALEKGAVDQLEKMVELQFKVMDRQAEVSMTHALAEFKRRCPEIPQFKKGGSFVGKGGVEQSWYYAPLGSIVRFVDPILIELGLSYSWDSEQVDSGGESKLRITCTLRHVDGGTRVSTMVIPITGTSKMSPAMKWGGTRTFGKRLTLTDVLGITTQDDIDGYDSADAAEPIDEEQMATIMGRVEEVLVETPEHSTAERITSFLAFLGVDSINQIRKADYERALKMLDSKERQAKARVAVEEG